MKLVFTCYVTESALGYENRLERVECYANCDTCPDRFKCFTNSIIIEEPLHLTSGEARRYIIEKLKQHGIDGNCIAKYGYNGELAESGLM